jgi:hypothetical protein
MKHRWTRPLFIPAGFLVLALLALLGEKAFRERKALAEVREALKTNIDLRDFQQEPLTIRKALQSIEKKCAATGKRLPILIDYRAFLEDPDVQEILKESGEPSLFDEIGFTFPRYPKRMAASTALRLVLAKIKVPATYVIRPDGVSITPLSKELHERVCRVYPLSGPVVIKEPGFWERIREELFGRP